MTNALRILFSTVLTLGAISLACSAGETVGTGSSTGTANTTGGAGTGFITGAAGTGAGNVTGAAGTTATGRGGTNTGNVTGTAGTTATGRGGTSATGAAGTSVTGAAGTSATGAAGTTGSATCGANFEIAADGFARAPASAGGCWSGYAFAGGDAGSSITPTSFMACGMPCMLRMMGTVGAATAANSYAGVGYIGFNIGQAPGTTGTPTVSPKGTGLNITFTASTGSLPLRVQLGADSTGSVSWCYTIASPASGTAMVPYAMFNRTCWDNMGAAYNKEPIVSIQMVVPGGAMATPSVSVAITSVKEY